ncbi:MAG: hypothetical protein HY677_06375 [Chloroflexi bacterium]|nr:hypothetical protein [Chloroflexota bacterium]
MAQEIQLTRSFLLQALGRAVGAEVSQGILNNAISNAGIQDGLAFNERAFLRICKELENEGETVRSIAEQLATGITTESKSRR